MRPDHKSGRGRDRSQQHIGLLQGVLKILLHERADLLRLAVVGVEVPGGERIGADHDPPLHLGAEPFGADLFVVLEKILRYLW